MKAFEERVDDALATITSLTKRFSENFEDEKPITYDAYEEEILNKVLPDDQHDKYEFFLNKVEFSIVVFVLIVIPTVLFLNYSEPITDRVHWFAFFILALAGYGLYKIVKYTIITLMDYKREKKHAEYWEDIRANCEKHLERIENLKAHQSDQEDTNAINPCKQVTITEVTPHGDLPLFTAYGTDEHNRKHCFKVPVLLGSHITDKTDKGTAFVIERDRLDLDTLSAAKLIAGKYNFYFADLDGAKEKPLKSVFYSIYYRLHLAYLLSHKDAVAIIKRYEKIKQKTNI